MLQRLRRLDQGEETATAQVIMVHRARQRLTYSGASLRAVLSN
jgi:hypothetical protein